MYPLTPVACNIICPPSPEPPAVGGPIIKVFSDEPVTPFIDKLPVTYAPFVIRKEPVISVFEFIETFVPSSVIFESFIWKPFDALVNRLFVKCVSLPTLLYVSGAVITVEDVIAAPDVIW